MKQYKVYVELKERDLKGNSEFWQNNDEYGNASTLKSAQSMKCRALKDSRFKAAHIVDYKAYHCKPVSFDKIYDFEVI